MGARMVELKERVGFIGTGIMGAPMALRLKEAGYAVTAYNRTESKLVALVEQGVEVTVDLATAVRHQEVLVLMLADDAALTALVESRGGVLAHVQPGTVVINMSTIAPLSSRRLASAFAAKEVSYLDAPVSGSAGAAKSGQLVALVGGDKAVFERVRPLLSAMTKEQFYFGEAGSGNDAKLVINLQLALTMQAIAESLVLAESLGLQRGQVLDMMQSSSLSSAFFGIKRSLLETEDFTPAFALKHMRKDLSLVLDAARPNGAVLPNALTSFGTYTAAVQNGLGEEDLSAVVVELLRQSGYTGENRRRDDAEGE
ncbi:MAG: NAD(P)-dependent oxidoreductase [Alicyclobacillaceae bacterium]|uniref:NAD(P)-dependent oxidoreductase n=1 Tax=Alicyclobacillus sp. SP_1 TaxID=2942475 RepID=UPI002158514F|nr:NAD(P)-dependent oxidoreductase [Alicyclobacillus sp. SP_1]MCY0887257.1 NAD(P)-dependent oxidoreductase [Alicyclobacillaceae bacterium]